MGCASAKVQPAYKFAVKPNVIGQGNAAASLFHKMLLDRWTVDALYTSFVELDVSRTGKVDLDSFYDFFGFSQCTY